MRRFFLFGIILIFHGTSAFADITLTAGEWSTTFNCGDWTQTDGVSTVNVNCDGLKGLSTSWFCEGTEETEITAAANYSGGGGGSGLRFRYSDNDGSTAQVASGSTGMSIVFAGGAVDEFWMRFYVRFASGFQQDRALYHKYLYLSDSFGGNGRYIDTNAANDEFRIGNSLQQLGTYSFDDFYGATSDGSWHCIEFHLSVSGTTAEYWVDGVQRGSIANADWGAMTGFAIVNFLQNMKNLYDTGDCWTVDVDDIAVSTNGYIGPLEVGPLRVDSFACGSVSGVDRRYWAWLNSGYESWVGWSLDGLSQDATTIHAWSIMETFNHTRQAGDKLRLQVSGDEISLYINDFLTAQATDDMVPDTVSGSSSALGVFSTATYLDNWETLSADMTLSSGPLTEQTCSSDPVSVNLTSATNLNADCEYSTGAEDFAFGEGTDFTTTGGTSHSNPLSLACSDSYDFHIRCSNGINEAHVAHSITVGAPGGPSDADLRWEDFEGSAACGTGQSYCRAALDFIDAGIGTITVGDISSNNPCSDAGIRSMVLSTPGTGTGPGVAIDFDSVANAGIAFMWKPVSADLPSDTNYQDLLDLYNVPTSQYVMSLFLENRSGDLRLGLYVPGQSNVYSSNIISLDTWYDVRLIYTSGSTAVLKINGSQVAQINTNSANISEIAFAALNTQAATWEIDTVKIDSTQEPDPCE